MAAIWAGVVPQQPPMIVAPALISAPTFDAISSGDSRKDRSAVHKCRHAGIRHCDQGRARDGAQPLDDRYYRIRSGAAVGADDSAAPAASACSAHCSGVTPIIDAKLPSGSGSKVKLARQVSAVVSRARRARRRNTPQSPSWFLLLQRSRRPLRRRAPARQRPRKNSLQFRRHRAP